MNEAIERLKVILADSIILRMDFIIESVGCDVEEATGYTSKELFGQPLRHLCSNSKLPILLKTKLGTGYFDAFKGKLLNKEGEILSVIISGFYLGLISDINGFIVLKVKVVENTSLIEKELAAKQSEIDSFIYRTSHDLRGPLATIKGLVNLLKLREDDVEVDKLTSLVELHANKLDDRLFKLLYLSDAVEPTVYPNEIISFQEMEYNLRNLLIDNCQLDSAVFKFHTSVNELKGVNESKICLLLRSIILFVVNLPLSSIKQNANVSIVMDCSMSGSWMRIEMMANGFIANDEVQNLIENSYSVYNDLLEHPYLFNYYVAQKRAMQLGATLKIDFYGSDKQVIKLLIPKDIVIDL